MGRHVRTASMTAGPLALKRRDRSNQFFENLMLVVPL
jgi:hypothetical protein